MVDDNPSIHDDFRKVLTRRQDASAALHELEASLFGGEARHSRPGFCLDSAYQGQEALERVKEARAASKPYAVAFVDVRMPPGWNGVDTTAHLLQVDPDLQVVLCTAYSDYGWEEIVDTLGETDRVLILKKPFNTIEVRQLAHTLCGKWRLERASKRRMADLEQCVAERTQDLQAANEQLRHEMNERARAESELRKAQRLEALGRLAAGIGHEINNPLSFIVASVEAMQMEMEELEPVLGDSLHQDFTELLQAAAIGADRIAQIIRNIKLFARPSNAPAELVDISAALDLCARMVECEIEQPVEITLDVHQVPAVIGRRVEIEQVFINLLKNAAHALATAPCSRPQIRATSRLAEDGHVVVEIADNGPGIDDKHIDKIFDPFFTTKPVDQGSGLGLSICHSIVKGLGGEIRIVSPPGMGTTVTVRLPPAPVRSQQVAETAPRQRDRSTGNDPVRGRVLVVDDEPFILRTIERALRTHEVVAVTSGREALARILSEPFDVILCDIMMPGLSGHDIYQMIQQAQPEVANRMVFITGGALMDEVREFLARVPNKHIEKPFEIAALQEKVASAVRARRQAAVMAGAD